MLFVAVRKFVVPNFEKTFAERTEAIEGGLQEAETKQAEADAKLAELEQQLGEARHEAARIREEAREQGAAIVAEMREQAQTERHGSSSTARRRSRPSGSRRSPRCAPRWARWPPALAGRIVGESLDDEARQSRVVERFLADLETRSDRRGRTRCGQLMPSSLRRRSRRS